MPQSRSILKPASAPYSSSTSHQQHHVQFCSTTATYLTHSTSEYDRTPVDVPKNPCELPARGCPGLTYPVPSGDNRNHRHPRRLVRDEDVGYQSDRLLPSMLAIPPLVPDISESDDSDGLVSPPPESISCHTRFSSSPIPDSSLAFLPHSPSRSARNTKENESRSARQTDSCIGGKLRSFHSLSMSESGSSCLEGF